MLKTEKMVLVERVRVESFIDEFNYFNKKNWQTSRSKILVQRETLSIPLRSPSTRLVRHDDKFSFHTQLCRPHQFSQEFKITMSFLKQFAKRRNAILSRAMIVKLLPNKQVYPHIDRGEYYEIRDRYHLVLSSKGSRMLSGEQEETFVTGDLFYFNNHVLHEAHNLSEEDRIHVIFDLLPKNFKSYFKVFVSMCKTFIINSFNLK